MEEVTPSKDSTTNDIVNDNKHKDSFSAIKHIMVVGFHHQFGNHVEYVYPPITADCDPKTGLPDSWDFLPFVALPDGAHNSSEDYIFFTVPDVHHDKPTGTHYNVLYGISCYRQIASSDITNSDEKLKYTRSHIQKAVCVLSQVPFYGAINERLSLVTQAYFNQCNFEDKDLLQQIYHNLNATFSVPMPKSHLFFGSNLREFVLLFRRNFLLLFKLIMLQKKIIVYSIPCNRACTLILSLLSLYPEMLNANYTNWKSESQKQEAAYGEFARFGLPLQLFHPGIDLFYYLSLRNIDLPQTKDTYLAGASNMLFTREKVGADVIIDAQTGEIKLNSDLNKILALTPADKRFIDYICLMVENKDKLDLSTTENKFNISTKWEGSEEWVRSKFWDYLKNFLGSVEQIDHLFDDQVDVLDLGVVEQWGCPFAKSWMETRNFEIWRLQTVSRRHAQMLAKEKETEKKNSEDEQEQEQEHVPMFAHPSGPALDVLNGISDGFNELAKSVSDIELEPIKAKFTNVKSDIVHTWNTIYKGDATTNKDTDFKPASAEQPLGSPPNKKPESGGGFRGGFARWASKFGNPATNGQTNQAHDPQQSRWNIGFFSPTADHKPEKEDDVSHGNSV